MDAFPSGERLARISGERGAQVECTESFQRQLLTRQESVPVLACDRRSDTPVAKLLAA